MHQHQRPKTDFGTWAILALFALPTLLAAAWVVYLIFSVIYFGGGDACPQNLC